MIDGSTAPADAIPRGLSDTLADVAFLTGYRLGRMDEAAASTEVTSGSTAGAGRVNRG